MKSMKYKAGKLVLLANMSSIVHWFRPLYIITTCFLLLMPPHVSAEQIHTNLSTTGKDVVRSTWVVGDVDSQGLRRITIRSRYELQEFVTSADYQQTLQWDYVDLRDQRHYQVMLEGSVLNVTDTKGKLKQYDIGDLPWWQPLPLALHSVVGTEDKALFVVFRTDNFSLNTLEAQYKGAEIIDLQGKPFQSSRMQVSLPGLKKAFWKANFWLSEAGEFLQFKGKNGFMQPETHIQMIDSVYK